MSIVILDKNFVQGDSANARGLKLLVEQGYRLAVTDTLIYESFSDEKRPQIWQSVKNKLAQVAEYVDFWRHGPELARHEILTKRPVDGPLDSEFTVRFRSWLKASDSQLRPDWKPTLEKARFEREVHNPSKIPAMAHVYLESMAPRAEKVFGRQLSQQEIGTLIGARSPQLTKRILHGYTEPDAGLLYFPEALEVVNDAWFLMHQARMFLAQIGVYIWKYGRTSFTGKKLANTKFDLEYLVLLKYADAIASNETSGDLALLRRWLYGEAKPQITFGSLRL